MGGVDEASSDSINCLKNKMLSSSRINDLVGFFFGPIA